MEFGIMKASVLLGGSFLLSLLFWNSSGLEPAVTSTCSDDWLVVRMKKKPFDNDTEARIGDIHLGNNCPVTRMLSVNYEFSYSIIYCGIKKIVFERNDAVILSEISYRPATDTIYKFQVACFVKRLVVPSLMPFGMNGYDASTLRGSAQGAKEQQPSAHPPSKKCGPQVSTVKKEQLPMNHCINNAHAMTPSPP
ncbi:oocyte-secreted protein 4B [Tupaia chinensis]|uniref:oocyte-secreted protein 4B n=1 Tax=Tupaia chinensis TaxID=246437 RepID=UPI0003C90053|nr:oocyte-secreted protein 4B [Tupaia chinensis]